MYKKSRNHIKYIKNSEIVLYIELNIGHYIEQIKNSNITLYFESKFKNYLYYNKPAFQEHPVKGNGTMKTMTPDSSVQD